MAKELSPSLGKLSVVLAAALTVMVSGCCCPTTTKIEYASSLGSPKGCCPKPPAVVPCVLRYNARTEIGIPADAVYHIAVEQARQADWKILAEDECVRLLEVTDGTQQAALSVVELEPKKTEITAVASAPPAQDGGAKGAGVVHDQTNLHRAGREVQSGEVVNRFLICDLRFRDGATGALFAPVRKAI